MSCFNKLQAGYSGLCYINGNPVRVSSFDVNVNQEVSFYDHVLGLRDSVPSGKLSDSSSTKSDVGNLNIQKYFWRPGVISISGSISFPPDVGTLGRVFQLAKRGDPFSIEFFYAKRAVKRTLTGCTINSFKLSISASDILQLSIDIYAKNIEETEVGSYAGATYAQKLISYDAFSVVTDHAMDIQSFELSISNSLKNIYTAKSINPFDIRVGMQAVVGSIVYYYRSDTIKKGDRSLDLLIREDEVDEEKTKAETDLLNKGSSSYTIKLAVNDPSCGGSFNEEICVIYEPVNRSSSLSALTQSVAFKGIGYALGK
jgi:hypothetical protein